MALSRHVDPDKLIQQARDKKAKNHAHHLTNSDPTLMSSAYGARYGTSPLPKYKIPYKVTDR